MPAGKTLDYVLSDAGARPWDRDEADRSVVNGVRKRDGQVIDCVTAEPLVLEKGLLSDATNATAVLRRGPESSRFRNSYKDYLLEVVRSDGSRDTRRITSFDPESLRCEIDPPWGNGEVPAPGTRFAVMQSCSLNAGGWLPMKVTRRRLTVPLNHDELLPSGYSRLEAWIHEFTR